MQFKLGRLPYRDDVRTLKFSSYINTNTLPPLLESVQWSKPVSNWGMMLNDKIGDCTCAGAGHLIQTWTANNGEVIRPNDKQILEAYKAVSGYDGSTYSDKGAVMLDVLKYWKNTGIAEVNIDSFTLVDYKNIEHVKQAINLFGGVYVGINLPSDFSNHRIWYDSGNRRYVGGHCIDVIDYDKDYLTCVTWGELQKMTYGFWNAYVEECWAIIDDTWAQKNKNAPNGFNYQQLQEDLQLITKK